MTFESQALSELDRDIQSLLDNPIERFSFSHPNGRTHGPQRLLVEHVLQGHETALAGSNQSGKTQGGAALLVHLAEGRDQIGDIALPKLQQPTVWWALTQTYKQQVESTQQAVLKWLGTWPHKVRYVSGQPEAAQLILVKPKGGSNDPKKWSRIWFHVQATGESLPGGRVNGVWADEPPNIRCWEEATARGSPGRPFYLWITYTPIKRAEWEPLKIRYEGCDNKLVHGRIKLHATVFDNPWLDETYVESLKDLWRGQWDYDARMHGAEVDDTGQCPFTNSAQLKEAMSRWQGRVRHASLKEFKLWSEDQVQGGKHQVTVPVEVYWTSDQLPGETFVAFVDPSLGIADPTHDPGALHVYSRMVPRLVARFHGYLEPYALGQLAGKVMEGYCRDPIDVEMNDNLGIQVIRGARATGHDNFCSDFREDKITGQMENVLGWKTTATNRGGMIAAVQQLLLEDGVDVRSQGLLDGLRGVVVNSKGRIEAGMRKHDEDMILLGRFGIVSRGTIGTRERTPPSVREQLLELLGQRIKPDSGTDDWTRRE